MESELKYNFRTSMTAPGIFWSKTVLSMKKQSATSLKSIIGSPDTKHGRAFDITIQVLIAYSPVTFSIETLPGLDPTIQRFLAISEGMCVALFTLGKLAHRDKM